MDVNVRDYEIEDRYDSVYLNVEFNGDGAQQIEARVYPDVCVLYSCGAYPSRVYMRDINTDDYTLLRDRDPSSEVDRCISVAMITAKHWVNSRAKAEAKG